MSRKTINLSDELYQYLHSVSLREHSILKRLREETASHPQANMQIAPEQGQFMGLLVKLMGARRILEIGTFTGYSSLSMALPLPIHGRITTCDINEEWTNIAQRYWKEAGVDNRIELRLGQALDTIDRLLAEDQERKFDLVFIDADKENYVGYYEYALKLLRPGGLILVDNVLWSGKVIEGEMQDKDTIAIRSFNEYLKNDTRIMLSMISLGDGLTLAVKN